MALSGTQLVAASCLLLISVCGSAQCRATALTTTSIVSQQRPVEATTIDTKDTTKQLEAAATQNTLTSGKSVELTIKAICKNRAVPIQSIDEMLKLIKEIDKDEWRCHDNYMAAIYELEPILMQPKERFCEDMGFALIKRYHFRFIQPYARSNRTPTEFDPAPKEVFKGQLHPEPRKHTVEFDEHDKVLQAPLSVRHFWLKFALQVSYQCKMDLVKNLVKDQTRVLKPDDLELMKPFGEAILGSDEFNDQQQPANGTGKAAESSPSIDFDSVLYMPELDGRMLKDGEAMEETGGGEHQHLRTNSDMDSALYQMIIACKSRFRPMYEKLILPVVRLSKLGYDYQGPIGWTGEERTFLKSGLMRLWLVTVHVCEIFKNTHLVQMNDDEESEEEMAEAERKRSREALREALNSIEDEEEEHEDKRQKPPPEGKLSAISADEEAKLRSESKSLEELMKPVDYKPSERFQMSNQLMIATVRDLDLELSRKEGHTNPFGFFGFLRRLASFLKSTLAKLDPNRFAHYRKNSLWYSGVLNFFSSVVSAASITVTVVPLLAHG